MLTRTGRVSGCHRDRVDVRLDATMTCAACGESAGCGIGPVVNLLRKGPETWSLAVPGQGSFRPGERVRVALQPENVLRAAMIAYALPLAGGVGGAWLASALAPAGAGDGWSAIGALAGLAAACLQGRRLSSRIMAPRLLRADGQR